MLPDISQFIDIHAHILPGIDDGPKTIIDSADMARCYIELGIRAVIATPHFLPGTAWAASREKINVIIKAVQSYYDEHQIDLKVYPGMEIAYHKKIVNRLEGNLLQSLAGSKYYLLEPSFRDPGYDLLQCAEQLMEQGYKVILAHPERIQTFQENLAPLCEAVSYGLEVQLNSGSILGKFGELCKKTAMQLIATNTVHYIASDAHSAADRRPLNSAEWQQLSNTIGNDLLSVLCISNPQKIIQH